MSNLPESLVIRDINELSEMHEVENLQREVWGVTDLDVYPALALRPQREVGAILIGAFAKNELAGFVFGFPGIFKGKTIIHSDMLGVRPAYRTLGLGYLLKLAQRERALKMGIDEITWTFDPLQLRNANLNFAKLGVIADRYDINFYGETSSFLHRFGTDRLWVTWLLNSDRVKSRIDEQTVFERTEGEALVRVGENNEPIAELSNLTGSHLRIEIPRELNEQTAERWRLATREAFTRSLKAGYRVDEFVVSERADRKTGTYLLVKSDEGSHTVSTRSRI